MRGWMRTSLKQSEIPVSAQETIGLETTHIGHQIFFCNQIVSWKIGCKTEARPAHHRNITQRHLNSQDFPSLFLLTRCPRRQEESDRRRRDDRRLPRTACVVDAARGVSHQSEHILKVGNCRRLTIVFSAFSTLEEVQLQWLSRLLGND